MNESKPKGHVTETPDVSYIKNVDVTHEVSDVYISGIARFAVGLSILMIASFLLVWGMFRVFDARLKEPPRSPMALGDKERLPPQPRLQGAPGFGEGLEKPATSESEGIAGAGDQPKDPLWEIKAVRDRWNDVLTNGPVDKDGKRYGMPIERAKEEILKQGLPARTQAADGQSQTADSRRQ
jgi:hypothetical protein